MRPVALLLVALLVLVLVISLVATGV